jgi:hypothetical protein
MTLPTYPSAIDQINEQFMTAWQAGAIDIVGYVPEIRWDGNEKATPPDGQKFWVLHSVQNVKEMQASLSDNTGLPGQKRYTSLGLVIIQFFMPKNVANAKSLGRTLAMIAKNAYRGKNTANGIWFKNVRINDLPTFEDWYRLNVIAEYSYDELA